MSALIYFIRLRLQAMFSTQDENLWSLIFSLLIFTFFPLYGFGALQLLSILSNEAPDYLPFAVFGVQLTVFFIIVLKDYFPSFSPLQEFFRANLPLSSLQKIMYHLTYDLVAITPIGLISFSLILAFSPSIGMIGFVNLILLVILGITLVRQLKTFGHYQFSWSFLRLTLLLLLGISPTIILWPGLLPNIMQIAGLGSSLLILISYSVIVEEQKVHLANKEEALATSLHPKAFKLNRLLWNAFWRNKNARNTMLIAIVVKILMVSPYAGITVITATQVEDPPFILLLFLNPIILFTYVFDNLAGYLPQLSRLSIQAQHQMHIIWKTYRIIVFPTLLIDVILSVCLIFLIGLEPTLNVIALVVWSAIFCIVTSLIGIALVPMKTKKVTLTSFNLNVHPGLSLIQVFIILSLMLVIQDLPFYVWLILFALVLLSVPIVTFQLRKKEEAIMKRILKKVSG